MTTYVLYKTVSTIFIFIYLLVYQNFKKLISNLPKSVLKIMAQKLQKLHT